MLHRTVLFLVLLLSAITLAACGSDDKADPVSTTENYWREIIDGSPDNTNNFLCLDLNHTQTTGGLDRWVLDSYPVLPDHTVESITCAKTDLGRREVLQARADAAGLTGDLPGDFLNSTQPDGDVVIVCDITLSDDVMLYTASAMKDNKVCNSGWFFDGELK